MAVAIPLALAAVSIGRGIAAKAKLKKEAANLERNRAISKTSQYNRDALALSESELANGMSAQSQTAYNDATDRGLSTSISALLKGGGSVNNIGDIYDSSEQGRQQLAVMQDQMRLAHIANVVKQYGNMSDSEEKNWLVNEYGPYKDKLQAIGQQREAAEKSITSGLSMAGSALMNKFGGNSEATKLGVGGASPSSGGFSNTAPINNGTFTSFNGQPTNSFTNFWNSYNGNNTIK